MPRKFVYLVNPVSGTKAKDLGLEMIKKRTEAKSIPFEILSTNAEGDYAYLRKKIIVENITDLIICGGDGTVNQVADACRQTEINFGIIPFGSGNGLAFAAKIPRQVDKALDIIFRGKAEFIDSFYINNKFSCMLSGLGFDAQVAHDFARQKKRGLATYIQQSLRNFFAARPYPFIISVEGRELSTEAFFISIANSNQFGNNFTIAPRASLQDGLLDIIVVNKMSKLRMLLAVMKQLLYGQVRPYEDKKYHHNAIHYFHARRLVIQNPMLAPLHIDGDPAVTAPAFEIEIIVNALKLIMP